MTELDLKLCTFQAKFFAESLKKTSCSSCMFIRHFVYSDFATRLDNGGYFTGSDNIDVAFDELNDEFNNSNYGTEKYTENELYWMGYIYRYFCCLYSKTTKQAYKTIKPKELRALYFPYHSLDPKEAIDRILEAKDLNFTDYTSQGVKILRRILKKKLHINAC